MSGEKNIKICSVERMGDCLDFVTFMELFAQLPKDGKKCITIILGFVHFEVMI